MKNKARVLTCVYCGQDTPAWGDQVLTDHIKNCEKHPMRKIRKALAALVGADTIAELEAIEATLRLASIPDQDKTSMINAIHVLIETMPDKEECEDGKCNI